MKEPSAFLSNFLRCNPLTTCNLEQKVESFSGFHLHSYCRKSLCEWLQVQVRMSQRKPSKSSNQTKSEFPCKTSYRPIRKKCIPQIFVCLLYARSESDCSSL